MGAITHFFLVALQYCCCFPVKVTFCVWMAQYNSWGSESWLIVGEYLVTDGSRRKCFILVHDKKKGDLQCSWRSGLRGCHQQAGRAAISGGWTLHGGWPWLHENPEKQNRHIARSARREGHLVTVWREESFSLWVRRKVPWKSTGAANRSCCRCGGTAFSTIAHTVDRYVVHKYIYVNTCFHSYSPVWN